MGQVGDVAAALASSITASSSAYARRIELQESSEAQAPRGLADFALLWKRAACDGGVKCCSPALASSVLERTEAAPWRFRFIGRSIAAGFGRFGW